MSAQSTSTFLKNPEESFFLRSTSGTVVADGCFKRIDTPAQDGYDLNGTFQQSMQNAIREAKQAGIENPLVVGAIPFDPSRPSALYIPKQWHKQTDEETKKQVEAVDLKKPEVASSELLPEHDEFVGIVGEAVNEIREGRLKKVVLSRLRNITTKTPVDSGALLARLIQLNPVGHNFHVPLSDGSKLIGSSPELILRKHGREFATQPLAGSAGRGKTAEEDAEVPKTLLKSPKDLYEHKLVVDSVRNTLSPRSADLNVPQTPEVISTPKLWHLATTVKGNADNEHESALSLACLLHPTPALSGFPHETSRQLLSRLEPFDREYFGGIIGYCDSEGNGEWFITIRSGRIDGKNIQLFAGAGIVGDSVPESEWKETGIKLTTMLHVFDLA